MNSSACSSPCQSAACFIAKGQSRALPRSAKSDGLCGNRVCLGVLMRQRLAPLTLGEFAASDQQRVPLTFRVIPSRVAVTILQAGVAAGIHQLHGAIDFAADTRSVHALEEFACTLAPHLRSLRMIDRLPRTAAHMSGVKPLLATRAGSARYLSMRSTASFWLCCTARISAVVCTVPPCSLALRHRVHIHTSSLRRRLHLPHPPRTAVQARPDDNGSDRRSSP